MYHGIGYGIHTGQVGTFEGVASVTGKGEIMKAVIDKMLLRNDVFNMEGNKRRCLFWNSTIFAPPLSSLTHNRSCGCIHDYREGFARTLRALACKIEITSTASTNSRYSASSSAVMVP